MKLSLCKGIMILVTTVMMTVVSYAKNPDIQPLNHSKARHATSLENTMVIAVREVIRTRKNVITTPRNVVVPKNHIDTTVRRQTTIHANRITVNNRHLVFWTAGAGVALTAGAYCYVEKYGNGTVKERKCYIGTRGFENFYVVDPQ